LTSAWLLLHEVALSFTFVARSRSCIKPLALITRDEYLQPHFEVSRPTQVLDLDRIVQCAEGDGLCSLDEMNEMIQDLETLNKSCKDDTRSEGCSMDSVEARDAVKHALASQIELAGARQQMKKMDIIETWREQPHDVEYKDHAFDHFVDYRYIGECESH